MSEKIWIMLSTFHQPNDTAMRVFLLSLILLHAVLHVIGFIKAYRLARLPQVQYPISRGMGLLWLMAFVLFVVTGLLFFHFTPGWWIVCIVAVGISEYLMIQDWEDTGLGTAANITILLTAIIGTVMYSA